MSNPINDYFYEEMIHLHKISDDELETEWIVAQTLADKRGFSTDYRELELVESEIAFRNRNSNSTWRPDRFTKVD